MFTPFECADCGGTYVPTSDACLCTGCGDRLPLVDITLEWGEVYTVEGGVCGYTHKDDCAVCASGETAWHAYEAPEADDEPRP